MYFWFELEYPHMGTHIFLHAQAKLPRSVCGNSVLAASPLLPRWGEPSSNLQKAWIKEMNVSAIPAMLLEVSRAHGPAHQSFDCSPYGMHGKSAQASHIWSHEDVASSWSSWPKRLGFLSRGRFSPAHLIVSDVHFGTQHTELRVGKALHGRKDRLPRVVQMDSADSVAPEEDRCPQLKTSSLMCHNVSAHSAALLQLGMLSPAPCYWIPANSTVLMEMADISVYPLWAQSKSN